MAAIHRAMAGKDKTSSGEIAIALSREMDKVCKIPAERTLFILVHGMAIKELESESSEKYQMACYMASVIPYEEPKE